MIEIWEDIQGYEGRYRVSNLGNVLSFCRPKYAPKPLLMKFKTDRYGYYTLSLNKNKKKIWVTVHRLV